MVLHLQRFRMITANQIVEILIGASPLPGSMVSPAVTIEATKSFNRGTIVFKLLHHDISCFQIVVFDGTLRKP